MTNLDLLSETTKVMSHKFVTVNILNSWYFQVAFPGSHEAIRKSSHLPWPGGSVGWSAVPYTKNIVDSIPGKGTYVGCKFGPWSGHVQEATN